MKVFKIKTLIWTTFVICTTQSLSVLAQKKVRGQLKSAKENTKNRTASVGITAFTDHIIPLDPNVRTGKLANGFTYYIRKNTEPRKRVVMYLANKVGSVLETDDQQGLAHFMEHMSFNGTKNFPKNELVNYLQKSGVRFGADLNAFTGFDETVYQLPLPSDDLKILKNGIQIMRDWAQEATISEDEVNTERGVIMEEKRLGKGSTERMQRQIIPLLLNNSRYAQRIPIGLESVILNSKPKTIRQFYKDWYRPNLQALIVVGDIDMEQMEQTIKTKFSDLKNPENQKSRTNYSIPLLRNNHFLAVTDKEMTNTIAQVIIKHRQPLLKTETDYRNLLIIRLFNKMLSERYSELSRQSSPPYIQGSANIEDLLGDLDCFNATLVAKPGELEKGFKAVWRETKRVQLFGFTQSELERAKQTYASSLEALVQEKDKTESEVLAKAYLQNFLKKSAIPGIIKESEILTRLLPDISLKDLDVIVKSYIKDLNRDIILMAPEKDKASLPSQSTVLGWIKSVDAEKLDAFKDDVSSLPLFVKTPKPGKLIKEEKDNKLGTTTLTFSNGAIVTLKNTDFKNNEIGLSAFSFGGTSIYSDADFENATNATAIVTAGGLGNYNATQLGKYRTGKQISLVPYIGERTQGFGGSSTTKDLETMLQFLYGYFTEPRKDSVVFNRLISNAKNQLKNRLDDPNAVFSDTVKAVLSNYNVRRTGPSLEKVNQINLDRVYEIYKERFSSANGMRFTLVGNINIDSIKPLLEKYVGALPSKDKIEQTHELDIHVPEGIITKVVNKGTEDKATVYLVFSGLFDYSYENKLKFDALKEVLQIRLLERLREKESGVYSPSVQVMGERFPKPRFGLVISFGCAPANKDRLIASALDEIANLRSNGPAQTNIDKYKAEEKRQHESELTTNGFWLNYINGQQLNNDPLDQVFSYDASIDHVTAQSVRETANKYLTGKNFIQLILLPQK